MTYVIAFQFADMKPGRLVVINLVVGLVVGVLVANLVAGVLRPAGKAAIQRETTPQRSSQENEDCMQQQIQTH